VELVGLVVEETAALVDTLILQAILTLIIFQLKVVLALQEEALAEVKEELVAEVVAGTLSHLQEQAL
jgi:hypothetical protein